MNHLQPAPVEIPAPVEQRVSHAYQRLTPNVALCGYARSRPLMASPTDVLCVVCSDLLPGAAEVPKDEPKPAPEPEREYDGPHHWRCTNCMGALCGVNVEGKGCGSHNPIVWCPTCGPAVNGGRVVCALCGHDNRRRWFR